MKAYLQEEKLNKVQDDWIICRAVTPKAKGKYQIPFIRLGNIIYT